MDYLQTAISIIKTIKQKGYEAYIIGGAVRDYLLSMPLNDIDMATNMPLDELMSIYSNKDLDGKKYLGIRLDVNGYIFEITNFRKDVSYSDHRHPVVEVVNSLVDDVKRRDFTVNALAMDDELNVIDHVNGITDLNAKTIRMIGDPLVRFEEDALRILRACYFAGKLDFEIENNTLNAMRECKNYIQALSDDRIFEYLIRILYSKNDRGINYLNSLGLLDYNPEYKNLVNIFSKTIDKDDILLYYYLKSNEFLSVTTSADKKLAMVAMELINNDFSLISLFYNQKYLNRLNKLFISLGYNGILEKGKSLVILSEKELAVSPKEISKLFTGSNITKAIKSVIEAILNGKINNSIEDINMFLKDLTCYD